MRTILGMIAFILTLNTAAHAASLSDRCYRIAIKSAIHKVRGLSSKITKASRIRESQAVFPQSGEGIAQVQTFVHAAYSDGTAQDYLVTVPLQLTSLDACSANGEVIVSKVGN